MAPRMKHWAGLALAGCALLSLWKLPPSAGRPRETGVVSPQEGRLAELRRDARRTQEVLQRVRWADSLPALAVATARGGLSVGGDPALLGEDELAELRSLLERELGEVPGRSAAVVGFFVQPRGFGAEEEGPLSGFSTSETYLGTHDGTPYCIRVVAASRKEQARRPLRAWSPGGFLETCRLVARYGVPGPSVTAWLERGAARLTVGTQSPTPEATRRKPPFRFELFGVRTLWSEQDVDLQRCRGGRADACARILLDPARFESDPQDFRWAVEHSPALSIDVLTQGMYRYLPEDAFLVADLESEFGPERFGRFWTSPREVPQAFEEAFGKPLGAWFTGWYGAHNGERRIGPALPRTAVAGTMGMLALAGLIGAGWSLRRKVG